MTGLEFGKKFQGVLSIQNNIVPKYKPNAINEYCIENECQNEKYHFQIKKNNVINVVWFTKKEFKKHKLLDIELIRCLKYIGFDGIINVKLMYKNNKIEYALNCSFNIYN